MDGSGLGGGFLSGPCGGTLDLESAIPRHPEMQLGQPVLGHHQHHVNVNVMSGVGVDHRPVGLVDVKGAIPRGASMNIVKGKAVAPFNSNSDYNLSEEDEPSTEDGNGENIEGKKGSAWQRMKWTDKVVRLLISVVACVDYDGTVEGGEGLKRKAAVLQKKGKWKTVSKIMIGKGSHVSPQQCEDKFNDLNKRYKRLNDILGKGTSCKVVENPTLMDSMPHLSAKAKDDVRKILSSKQLFYKEMCSYHNGQRIPDCQELDIKDHLPPGRCSTDINVSGEEGDEEHHDTEDDVLNDENGVDRDRMGRMGDEKRSSDEDEQFWQHVSLDSFEVEMAEVLQDPTKSLSEKREWIKKQKLQIQEQRLNREAEALEIEKQRYKWLRYRSKKDRELERLRLENERMKLENEKRIMQLREKELEIDMRRSEASLEPSVGIDRLLGRDLDLGRHQ